MMNVVADQKWCERIEVDLEAVLDELRAALPTLETQQQIAVAGLLSSEYNRRRRAMQTDRAQEKSEEIKVNQLTLDGFLDKLSDRLD